MAEYIQREFLCNKSYDITTATGKKRVVMYDDVVTAPAADVTLVVHARWVDTEPEYNFERHCTAHYQCSKCGRRTGARQTRTYNYCPHCGAKMGEEETHEMQS